MDHHYLYLLSAALAIGLLIGLERGWQAREAKEGARIAGLRTYALIGLMGGVSGLLATAFGALILGLIFIGFCALIIVSYAINRKDKEDIGITSLIAALLTFLLGALASMGYVVESASAAIVTALLLRLKPVLHQFLQRIEPEELLGTLELLLISVVLLNIFPNKSYGPWNAINPFEIWWMVVLIAMISYLGYFANKLFGDKRGIFFTAIFAGFVSSTLITLHFARLSKTKPHLANLLAMGITLACGIMFFRMLLVVFILNQTLFSHIVIPGTIMGGLLIITGGYWAHTAKRINIPKGTTTSVVKNPLALKSAILFGLLLAFITLLVSGINEVLGTKALLAFAGLSGIADVDAITMSLSRLSVSESQNAVIGKAIIIAACANTLLKGILTAFFADRQLLIKAVLPLICVIMAGIATTFLL